MQRGYFVYTSPPPQVAVPLHLCQCSQPFRAALGLGCSSVESTCLACRRAWVQASELPKRVGAADSFEGLMSFIQAGAILKMSWNIPYVVCSPIGVGAVTGALRSHRTLEQQDSLVRPMWHICWWKPVLPGGIWKHRTGLNHSPVFRGHISLVTVSLKSRSGDSGVQSRCYFRLLSCLP